MPEQSEILDNKSIKWVQKSKVYNAHFKSVTNIYCTCGWAIQSRCGINWRSYLSEISIGRYVLRLDLCFAKLEYVASGFNRLPAIYRHFSKLCDDTPRLSAKWFYGQYHFHLIHTFYVFRTACICGMSLIWPCPTLFHNVYYLSGSWL